MNVSKSMLIGEVADDAELTKAKAADAVEAFLNAIVEHTAAGHRVAIMGFGTFATKTRAARTGRNPRTGLPVEIAASTTLTFKAAKPKA